MGIVQEIDISPNEQMVYVQPRICPIEKSPKILWDFDIQTDHLISARRTNLEIVNKKKKKENLLNCGLCRSSGPQSKIKRKRKER